MPDSVTGNDRPEAAAWAADLSETTGTPARQPCAHRVVENVVPSEHYRDGAQYDRAFVSLGDTTEAVIVECTPDT